MKFHIAYRFGYCFSAPVSLVAPALASISANTAKARARVYAGAVLSGIALASSGLANAQTVIKIGVAGPLTGAQAGYGKDMEGGVRMAIDQANAQHILINGQPVQFEIDSQDDQADPRVGVQVAQRLIDDKVSVVIGHFNSGTTIPASAVYAKANMLMVTAGATNPALTMAGLPLVFRAIPTDAQNAGNAGVYAATVTRAKRITILDDGSSFGQGEADEFEKAVLAKGGTVVGHEYTNDQAVDVSAQLTKLKSLNTDLVFWGGLDAQGAMVIKRMRQLGMTAQFVAGGGVMNQNFIDLAGASAEGAMAWEYGVPVANRPEGKTFYNDYKQKFGVDILAYAPYSYDATWLVIKAMEAAKSTGANKVATILRHSTYQGITGPIAFDHKGDLKTASSTLYVVKSGAWQPITIISSK